MQEYSTQILFRPEQESLRFLPEGPYPCEPGRFSWVAIQHGPDSTTGSMNVFDMNTGGNTTYALQGRPGFAFPTQRTGTFVVGLERRLRLFDTQSGRLSDLSDLVDTDVEGTVINDGVLFHAGVIFGTKDLAFKDSKAGLYLWRSADNRLFRLRSDQTCSNGKVVYQTNQEWRLLDIDTPTRTVVEYPLDADAGRIGEPRIVVDLRDDEGYPDGMIMTPDGQSVIVAIFNPNDAAFGEARQYGLDSGSLEAVWKTEGSPQVTCPQFVSWQGKVKLILTTAAEHMSPEKMARHSNAGCLFVGDTPFDQCPDAPVLTLS